MILWSLSIAFLHILIEKEMMSSHAPNAVLKYKKKNTKLEGRKGGKRRKMDTSIKTMKKYKTVPVR